MSAAIFIPRGGAFPNLRRCFRHDPVTRELCTAEILDRKLPETYWCEFLDDFPVWSPMTGEFIIRGRRPGKDGFLSDGASVPSLVYWIVSDTCPDVLFPAYGHDWIFSKAGVLPKATLSRQQCNAAISYWMRAVGAAEYRRLAVVTGLAIGSRFYWHAAKPAAKVESTK